MIKSQQVVIRVEAKKQSHRLHPHRLISSSQPSPILQIIHPIYEISAMPTSSPPLVACWAGAGPLFTAAFPPSAGAPFSFVV